MKENKPITSNTMNKLEENYSLSKKNVILRHALTVNSLPNVVSSYDFASQVKMTFTIDVKTMPATNQKQSGRCWIFAATNVLREIVAKKCNIKEFELSQSFVAFYDKLEKINYALESIIDLIDVDYDDRTLQHILNGGICDGGQWDMFVNIVRKYGICPKTALDETSQSGGTRALNSLLDANIRKFASLAKAAYANNEGLTTIRTMQSKLLDQCYALLVNCYGLPVKTFDFEYYDAENVYHIEKGLTPKSFYEKYIGDELDNYVSLINAPTKAKQFNKSYTIRYLGNVVEGNAIKHLNLSMERIKELIVKSLKNNEVVWFGSDVSFYGKRDVGIWDDKAFDYQNAFDLDFKMEKGEALDYRISAMNHAMVITGVALDEDKPTKWKIQNSWGTENGYKGYYVMSSSWFDQYVYQAVINKKYLSKEEISFYEEKPIELAPWDPMGSLAD